MRELGQVLIAAAGCHFGQRQGTNYYWAVHARVSTESRWSHPLPSRAPVFPIASDLSCNIVFFVRRSGIRLRWWQETVGSFLRPTMQPMLEIPKRLPLTSQTAAASPGTAVPRAISLIARDRDNVFEAVTPSITHDTV